jgi:hypothetical protein
MTPSPDLPETNGPASGADAPDSTPAEAAPARRPRAKKSPKTSAPAATTLAATNYPDYEATARRAYELYLERGGEHGQDQDDWYRAEQELNRMPQNTGMTKTAAPKAGRRKKNLDGV